MSERLTMRAYARHRKARGLRGGTHAAVAKAIKSGRIAAAVGEDGLIDPEIADRDWPTNTQTVVVATDEPATDGHVTYAEARRRLTVARATSVEYDLAERKRITMTVPEGEARLRASLELADGVLKSAPGRWGPRLVGLASIPEAVRMMHDIVEDIRAALRSAGDPEASDA